MHASLCCLNKVSECEHDWQICYASAHYSTAGGYKAGGYKAGQEGTRQEGTRQEGKPYRQEGEKNAPEVGCGSGPLSEAAAASVPV